MMIDYSFILDNFTWSYSRLNSYHTCPHMFYLTYLEEQESKSNIYSEFGSLGHELLEEYANGELSEFDLAIEFEKRFPKQVTSPPPPNKYVDLGEQLYNKGLEYFSNFNGDLFDGYTIVGVEERFDFEIDGLRFVAYVDLILRDNSNQSIKIVDHKSQTIKFLKNGNPSKTNEDDVRNLKRQMYLYSIPVKAKYGSVDELSWNLFKDGNMFTIDWDEREYADTIIWALDTIKLIKQERLWLPMKDCGGYFCQHICGVSGHCEYMIQKREEYFAKKEAERLEAMVECCPWE